MGQEYKSTKTIVPALLVSECCPFEYCKKTQLLCTMHLTVFRVKTKCCIQLWLLLIFSFQSYGPLIVFILILCNFHSCPPHSSVSVWDIFMKFYMNVYFKSEDDVSHTRMNVPLFYASLIIFFFIFSPKMFCMPNELVTILGYLHETS